MAKIPRLPPATSAITITFEVSADLRPYFTEWYLAAKEQSDTPETFTLRQLSALVRHWYVQKERNDVLTTEITELETDVSTFNKIE